MLDRDDVFTVTRCIGPDIRRTCRKTYVDVVAMTRWTGELIPIAVLWPDGRRFRIDEIMSERPFGATVMGWKTKTFHIRFAGWETELYLEWSVQDQFYRWWVWAFDASSPNPLKELRHPDIMDLPDRGPDAAGKLDAGCDVRQHGF